MAVWWAVGMGVAVVMLFCMVASWPHHSTREREGGRPVGRVGEKD